MEGTGRTDRITVGNAGNGMFTGQLATVIAANFGDLPRKVAVISLGVAALLHHLPPTILPPTFHTGRSELEGP